MKYTVAIIMCIAMLLFFAACSGQTATQTAAPEAEPAAAPTPSPTSAPTPSPTAAPTPEPTPVPLTSRADLPGIGFEQVTEEIYVCQSQVLFGQPFMALLLNEGEVDNPYEGFFIDYSKGRIAVGFAYENPSSEAIWKKIDEKYEEWGNPEELTPEQEAELQPLYDQLDASSNSFMLSPYIINDTGELSLGNADLCFEPDHLECIKLKYGMRTWDVFLVENKDELGYSFLRKIGKDDKIIDGYAIYADMQQDGYVSPQELRTKFGLVGLDENLEQKIVEEAYAKHEDAKKIIEEALGISITELLALK